MLEDAARTIITVALFFLILGSLVVIHEIGHFVVARLARVRVLEFGIGFPPRAKVLRSGGETLYTLNWLPIGGFVRLEGEDGDSDDPRSFVNAGFLTKLTILVAGVAMNVVLAVVMFSAIAFAATPYVGVRFYEVVPNSPAERAGLVAGDALVAVDGRRYEMFGADNVFDDLRRSAGQAVVLTVDRADGGRAEIPITLNSPEDVEQGRGALGISQAERPWEAYFPPETMSRPLGDAFAIGVAETERSIRLIVDGLSSLAGSIVTDPTAPPPAAGPVGIAIEIGNVFWGHGPIMTLYVAAILSANLALINILPLPPLDGGRILVLGIKQVAGHRVSVRAERLTYLIGFVFLFAFLIWITGFDLIRSLGSG